MDNESLNIDAIHSCKNLWDNFEEYGSVGLKTKVNVEYSSDSRQTVNNILEIVLIVNGYNPEVQLNNLSTSSLITRENYHLDFKARFDNKIRFDEKNSCLIITGQSSKMGNYKIIITQI